MAHIWSIQIFCPCYTFSSSLYQATVERADRNSLIFLNTISASRILCPMLFQLSLNLLFSALRCLSSSSNRAIFSFSVSGILIPLMVAPHTLYYSRNFVAVTGAATPSRVYMPQCRIHCRLRYVPRKAFYVQALE